MTARAKQYVSTEHDVTAMAQKYLALYARLITERNARLGH
jgi:hypothetical protein